MLGHAGISCNSGSTGIRSIRVSVTADAEGELNIRHGVQIIY